ncbi:keratin-associated protein 15-1-like [Saccopteryx leptura]|uniref:keratin-associated protein 15-1-like n=1 Tax=Saccopteryx leptura TaxID=249018 RepID=UPI00339BB6C6
MDACYCTQGWGIKASSTEGTITVVDCSLCCTAEHTSPVNMSYNYCSGNVSSRSLGGYLRYPGSSYDSFCPGDAICPPGPGPQGSSLYGACQETFWEPTSWQESCCNPRTTTLCRPYQSHYMGSVGCGSSGFGPFASGSAGVQSMGYRPGLCRPTHFSHRGYQSHCSQPSFGSRCFGQTY